MGGGGGGNHPRSRGVYHSRRHSICPRAGSSPLARGLRGLPDRWRRWRRIIPARAGFTPGRPRKARRQADHPRSRGVYLLAAVGHADDDRIIPARAGFTLTPPGASIADPDHPRSRGVYDVRECCHCTVAGSSPLARGLLDVVAQVGAVSRIIPARAGFTTPPTCTGSPPADHPRSRGVYTAPMRMDRSVVGSSPLARGLPAKPAEIMPGIRIIPARAGFTPLVISFFGGSEDHPRSRGVYRGMAPGPVRFPGSSPLARGLHGR